MRKQLTDITIERIILANAVSSYDNFLNILSFVSDKDFMLPFNRLLFRACCSVYKYEVPSIDKLTLINEVLNIFTIKKKDDAVIACEEAGLNATANINIQIDALYEISNAFDFTNIGLYLKKLTNISKKNNLMSYLESKADNLEKSLTDHDIKSIDLINDVEFGLLNLMQSDDISDDPEDIFLNMDAYVEKVLNNKVDMVGMRTGFPILDDRIDGFINGTLNVIAAYKKGGKSCMSMCIALHAAFKLGIPVLYIDTEMSSEQVYPRMLSRLTRIPEKRIKRGQIADNEREILTLASKALTSKGKYFHKYMPGFTLDAVVALIKKYHSKYGIGLVIFDYIKSGAQEDFSNIKEYQLLGNTTITLKDLSGILNIPILAAVQRGRSGDIADSDRIARYADTVIVLEEKTKEEVEKMGFQGGLHKFVIRHSRRGGETPIEGIGVHFRKSILSIQESDHQIIDYSEADTLEEEDISNIKDDFAEALEPKKDTSKMSEVAVLW
jgi:replicative DNA helicase